MSEQMMTVEEAREFFRLWPTWRHDHLISSVFKVDDAGIVYTNCGTYLSATGFITNRERVISSRHAPIGSWWRRDGKAFRLEREGDVSSGAIRITPNNFRWASMMVHTQFVESIFTAVFGSAKLARLAYQTAYQTGAVSANVPASPKTDKPLCTICSKPCTHGNSQAIFCSTTCAEEAVKHYRMERTSQRRPVLQQSESLAEVGIRQSADRALRFLAGINLQDHSIKEQRESVDIVRALVAALRPGAK